MPPISDRRRHVGLLFSLAALATLASCGGSSGTTPPPPPPPPGPEAAYVVAGISTTVSGGIVYPKLQVFDPDHPDHALATADLAHGPTPSSSIGAYVPATSFDATTGRVTTLGHAQALYLDANRLYSVDLRGGHSHVPQQVSAAADLCSIKRAWPLTRDGMDGWVLVFKNYGNGGCSGAEMIRLSGGMSAAVVPVPDHMGTEIGLDDAQGLFGGMIVARNVGAYPAFDVAFNDRLMTAWQGVAGSTAVMTYDQTYSGLFAQDPLNPGRGWLAVGNVIHQATWDAAGLVLGATVLTTSTDPTLMIGSVDGLDVTDAGTAFHVDRAAAVTALGAIVHPATGATFLQDYRSDSRLFLLSGDWNDTSGLSFDVQFAAPGDGAFTSAIAGTDLSQRLGEVVGGRGDVALVWLDFGTFVPDINGGSFDHAGYARLSAVDGSIQRYDDANLGLRTATRRLGGVPDVQSVWRCPIRAADSTAAHTCAIGAVVEQDLASGATMSLGTVDLPGSAGYSMFDASDRIEGVATTFVVPGTTSGYDLFLVVPGRAGSIVRLTHGGV